MDLGAYAQINRLQDIADKNGIKVPRLRGYRLMSEEDKIDYSSDLRTIGGSCCKDLCESSWGRSSWYTCDSYTRFIGEYYTRKLNGGGCEPRWERIHGFKRRKLKFAIKKKKRAIINQYETYNKYCGKDGILYIHARIGGNNWAYFGGYELVYQPWFIEKVDDAYDSTYCDIYAKIKQ